jgi:hypothetical protein
VPELKTVSFAGLDAIQCEPELANAELHNALEIKGKLAVAKRGGGPVFEKAQRAAAAGALGLAVVNTDDSLTELATGDNGYIAEIPIVMIMAKDAPVLLGGCDPASISWSPCNCLLQIVCRLQPPERACMALMDLCGPSGV